MSPERSQRRTNPTREAVAAAVAEDVGVTAAEIAERVGVTPGTVYKHLRALAAEGMFSPEDRAARQLAARSTLDPLPRGGGGGAFAPTRAAVVADQRRRALTAARTAAREDGLLAVTVDAVIKRASISRRTFYEHFADLPACLVDALREIDEPLRLGNAQLDAAGWRATRQPGPGQT